MSTSAHNLANPPETSGTHMFTVLIFGPVAQMAGSRQLRVTVGTAQPGCADLRQAISRQYPSLAGVLSSCRFAVNHAFAPETHIVCPADDIALIGLVCGG